MKKVFLGSLSILLILTFLMPFYANAAGANEVSVLYQTHVQDKGWEKDFKGKYMQDGEVSGTEGESKRLEAIKIKLENNTSYTGGIRYKTHVEIHGWEKDYRENDQLSGTEGESKRLEAIQIELTGELADKYDVYYSTHAEKSGWLAPAKNGEYSGTAGYGFRLEGIRIAIVKKGSSAPNWKCDKSEKYIVNIPSVIYETSVQNLGWLAPAKNGDIAGTVGKSLRLEAIKMRISNNSQSYTGNIEYTTHVENVGWQNESSQYNYQYMKNNEVAGTTGENKRLEAIKIRLTGELADKYDIYYSTHAQNVGWLTPAKNGEASGTEGYGFRLEGIRIQLVNKGDPAPAWPVDDKETCKVKPTIVDPNPPTPTDEKIKSLTVANSANNKTVNTYDDIRVATIESSNSKKALTLDMLKCKITEAPVGVDKNTAIKYTNLGAGKFDVKLEASKPGTYKVSLVIEGTDVENNKYTYPEVITITVKDSYSIGAIKLFNDNDEVIYEYDYDSDYDTKEPIIIKKGDLIQPTIKYYHVYTKYDKTREYLEVEGEELNKQKLDIFVDIPNTEGLEGVILSTLSNPYNSNGKLVTYKADRTMNTGTDAPITKLLLETTETNGTDDIIVKIKDFEARIVIKVEDFGNIKGLTADGKNILTSDYRLDLYTTAPVGKKENVDYVDYSGVIYAIVPLKQLDTNGYTTRLTLDMIGKTNAFNKEGKVYIGENGDPASRDLMAFKYFTLNYALTYSETKITGGRVSAIGIAISNTADMTRLSKGISIKFDGASGREEVNVQLYIDGTKVVPLTESVLATPMKSRVPEFEITMPTNLEYTDGESINLEGLEVINKETNEVQAVNISDTIASLEKANEDGIQTITITLEDGYVVGKFEIKVLPVAEEEEPEPEQPVQEYDDIDNVDDPEDLDDSDDSENLDDLDDTTLDETEEEVPSIENEIDVNV